MVGMESYARIHHLNGKITIQINEFVLGHVFPYLLIVFVRFWLNSPPVRKNYCHCLQGQALSLSAGSGSSLVCVCGDILIQFSGLRLVSVLLSSCAALCLSCKTPY